MSPASMIGDQGLDICATQFSKLHHWVNLEKGEGVLVHSVGTATGFGVSCLLLLLAHSALMATALREYCKLICAIAFGAGVFAAAVAMLIDLSPGVGFTLGVFSGCCIATIVSIGALSRCQ